MKLNVGRSRILSINSGCYGTHSRTSRTARRKKNGTTTHVDIRDIRLAQLPDIIQFEEGQQKQAGY